MECLPPARTSSSSNTCNRYIFSGKLTHLLFGQIFILFFSNATKFQVPVTFQKGVKTFVLSFYVSCSSLANSRFPVSKILSRLSSNSIFISNFLCGRFQNFSKFRKCSKFPEARNSEKSYKSSIFDEISWISQLFNF